MQKVIIMNTDDICQTELLDHEDEGVVILHNVSNYLPTDTA
jgi:hypothetical protein